LISISAPERLIILIAINIAIKIFNRD